MLFSTVIEAAATARLAEVMKTPARRPDGDPVASSGRPDANRIMLLGGGLTSGWGVRTHGLALVGALQRSMQRRLGQPVDVHTVTAFGTEMVDAVELLDDQPLGDLDAIVVVFGASDALRYTPGRTWRQALERLLAELDTRSGGGPSVPIVVAGIPPLDSLSAFRSALTPVLRRHAETLNAITRQVVSRNRRAVFAPLPAMAAGDLRPYGSPAAYETWAEAIADRLAPAMPPGVARVGDLHLVGGVVGALPARVLSATGQGLRDRLRDAATDLRDRLDADFALVSLVNGDEVWTVADSGGGAPRRAPRAATYCGVTLDRGLLHVPDAGVDPRFADLELVQAYNLWSYVGISLRDEDGTAFGTVCAFNGAVGTAFDEEALRSTAALVEAVLSGAPGLAPDRPAPRTTPPALSPPAPAAPVERAPVRPAAAPRALQRAGGVIAGGVILRRRGPGLTGIAEQRSSPIEEPFEVAGPRPLRVLLVGGEYAVGFGAGSRADALDGSLARLLHARTGRGVVVENRARHRVRPDELAASLGPLQTADFDLVVWAPTFSEAARLAVRRRWRGGLRSMLQVVQRDSAAGVVLMGVPALLGAQPLAVAGRARAARLNRLLREVAAQHRRVLAAEPPPVQLRNVQDLAGADVYHDVAVRLLPTMLELLDPEQDDVEPADDRVPVGSFA